MEKQLIEQKAQELILDLENNVKDDSNLDTLTKNAIVKITTNALTKLQKHQQTAEIELQTVYQKVSTALLPSTSKLTKQATDLLTEINHLGQTKGALGNFSNQWGTNTTLGN